MPRLFKSTFVTWLLLFGGVAGRAATASMDEKLPLPADLFYEFKAVPADQNAIISWRRAAAASVPLTDKQRKIIKYCWTAGAREPSAYDLNELQAWLKRNQEAMEIFEASTQKMKAQWPERPPDSKQPELWVLPLMIRARLFAADQMAKHNQFAEAAKSLENTLKLTQTGVEGDAGLLNYLVAAGTRTSTQDAILRLACRKQAPVSILEELLKNLPSLTAETNIYDHILRVEFTHSYNESLDIKKLAENWSKISATNVILLGFYPEDLQRAYRIMIDPQLVRLHPKPYDANAEIEKSIRYYRIYRDNSLVPWTERSGEVELESETEHSNLVQEVAPLMALLKDDALPLSREVAQKARAAYVEIENPVGRILDTSILGFVTSDLKVCQVRTEREATRASLALIIFERRKGRMPKAFSELVDEKILDSVPLDPFCGKSLNYSQTKRKIWSVSNDGVDDQGESGEGRWFEKDAVWQIPELN